MYVWENLVVRKRHKVAVAVYHIIFLGWGAKRLNFPSILEEIHVFDKLLGIGELPHK